jgi:transcriptional regulator with XRE-family HTH domain
MIKNKKQYRVAKSQLAKLKAALDASINTTVEMPKEIYEVMIAGIQSQIDESELKIAEFESLSEASKLSVSSMKDIGQLLIKARIARGYTQKELAEKINKTQQQIQQYEASEYKSANLTKLTEVAQALGVDVFDMLVPLIPGVQSSDMSDWSVDSISETTIEVLKSKSKWTGCDTDCKKGFGKIKLKAA